MTQSRRHFSEEFKRRAVARMATGQEAIPSLARELGLCRNLLYEWRKQYAPPPVSPSPHAERGPGGEVGTSGPGVRAASEGPGVRAAAEVDEAGKNQRLHQMLLDTAFSLTDAIRETTGSAPLNQLSAALGLILGHLLKHEAAHPVEFNASGEQVFRVLYTYPDGTEQSSPPWAEGDPAFEQPNVPGRLRSPFWDNSDGQADDSGDNAEGSQE